jgi:hypothetical protein
VLRKKNHPTSFKKISAVEQSLLDLLQSTAPCGDLQRGKKLADFIG